MKISVLVACVWLVASVASAQEDDGSVPDSYEAASELHVSFESEPNSVGLSRSDGAGGWEQIGLSPCDVVLAPGPIALALTLGNHAPTPLATILELRGGEHLLGRYDSRQGEREIGVGILIGTIIATLIGAAIGAGGFLAHEIDLGIGGLVAAASVGVVGTATGITLATLGDIATIDAL